MTLLTGVLPGLVTLLLTVLLPGWDPTPAPAREGVWPLAPRPGIHEGFDPPSEPWGPGHRGVDLEGRVGQPVRAALGGTITFAGVLAGKGVVVVDHGSTRTTYEPVEASVSVGDRVTQGQSIGTLRRGMSHCFPRACLHWGLRRGDTYLNPLTLVGLGPVRLLPLDGAAGGGGWGSVGVPVPRAARGPTGAV
jgi:murein DD-endopeptidase MepM/ murein hydrolase activator NlpD